MKQKKQRKILIPWNQRGAVELALFAMVLIFAVLITGYLTGFNSSTSNEAAPAPNDGWVYKLIPTEYLSQPNQQLHVQSTYSISIPQRLFTLGGVPGNGKRGYGLIPTYRYFHPQNPIIFLSYSPSVTTHTLFSHYLLKKAYASSPASDNHLQGYIPLVGDQGGIGSCSSWTTDYNMLGTYALINGYYTVPGGFDQPKGAGAALGGFAPMFTYSQLCTSASASCGTSFDGNFKILQNQGVDRRDDYIQGDYTSSPQPSTEERAFASNYKISGYTPLFSGSPPSDANNVVTDDTSIENAIVSGRPIAFGMYVLPTFDNATNANNSNSFIVQNLANTKRDIDKKANPPGPVNHAVMGFAYDKQGVWIENQWGTGWGLNGTAELTWDYINHQVNEAYIMSPITPQIIPTLPPPSPMPSTAPSTLGTLPPTSPCSTLNITVDPKNCGMNGSNIGLFCGGNCGVGGYAGILYQCQGTTLIGQIACSPKCVTCPGAPHADQCGMDTGVCGGGAPGISITPGPGIQCRASNGACAPFQLCSVNCSNCNTSNDCQSGYTCCH